MLLEGPSGVGKSDLALRAMAAGWRLVADDRVVVWISGGALFGRAPATLSGLVEARGLGVLAVGALRFAEIALVVACRPDAAALERVPLPEARTIAGLTLPWVRLAAREPSALARLERRLDGGPL